MKYLLMLLATGCGPYADPIAPDGNAECGSQKLGVLMAKYASDLDFACRPFPDLEHCTGSQRDAVEKKYEQLFKEWVNCE